jgi:hypothetical protein
VKIIDGQVTENFNLAEFVCKDGGEVILNETVIAHIQRLQKFRKWYSRSMPINSGYRTPAYNKKVGGSPNSQHLNGIATDISLPAEYKTFDSRRKEIFMDNVKNKWYELCKADGLGGGVGFYDTFFHLDSRANKSFWDLRK